jgi:hypothetical protein
VCSLSRDKLAQSRYFFRKGFHSGHDTTSRVIRPAIDMMAFHALLSAMEMVPLDCYIECCSGCQFAIHVSAFPVEVSACDNALPTNIDPEGPMLADEVRC